jgi:hypothetical protein
MSSKNGNGFSLKQMAGLTPPVNPVEAMRKQLALAVFDKVSEKDIGEMMAKLKELALAGDLKAMKMFLQLTVGDSKPEKPEASPKGMQSLADAVQNLVDEIRITKAEQADRNGDPLLKQSAKRITSMRDDEDDDDD